MRGFYREWEDICSHGLLSHYLKKTPENEWSKKDERGLTLLHYACLGYNKITRLLLHINVNVTNKENFTPLHIAVLAKNPYMINELCKNGASVRLSEEAPLDYAITLGYVTCAKLLIAYGDRLENFTPIEGLIPFVYTKGVNLKGIHAQLTVRAIESSVGLRIDTTELQSYQNHVCEIRQAAITLMGMRKFRNVWFQMDRFLVREIAKTVWELRLALL